MRVDNTYAQVEKARWQVESVQMLLVGPSIVDRAGKVSEGTATTRLERKRLACTAARVARRGNRDGCAPVLRCSQRVRQNLRGFT